MLMVHDIPNRENWFYILKKSFQMLTKYTIYYKVWSDKGNLLQKKIYKKELML